MEDRLGSPVRAAVEAGRLRIALPAGATAVFVAP
jgi:hypothetical protein